MCNHKWRQISLVVLDRSTSARTLRSRAQDGVMYLVIEYAQGGDLEMAIRDARGTHFPEAQIMLWFVQICLALHWHAVLPLAGDVSGKGLQSGPIPSLPSLSALCVFPLCVSSHVMRSARTTRRDALAHVPRSNPIWGSSWSPIESDRI